MATLTWIKAIYDLLAIYKSKNNMIKIDFKFNQKNFVQICQT